jgi:hypothetical protein
VAIAVTRTKATHRAGATVPVGAPSPKPYVTGETPLPQFTGTGSGANINWSDGGVGGTFNPATTANGQATTYTPTNEERVVTILGTDSGTPANTGTNTITIQATIPLNPAMGYETDSDQDTKSLEAKDKTPAIATYGPIFDSTPLQWMGRVKVQWQMLRNFWNYHRRVKLVWFVDQETGEMYRVRFDSALRQKKNGANHFDMSATIKGAR